jgi:hypothetical protein
MLHQRRTVLSNDDGWTVPSNGIITIGFIDERLFPGQTEVSTAPSRPQMTYNSNNNDACLLDDCSVSFARFITPYSRRKSNKKSWSIT